MTAWLVALLVSGCFDDAPERERRKRRNDPPVVAAPPTADAPPRTAPDGGPWTVVLVVLDTVRADHTSLCGYGRPTTPVLERLVADRGFAHTCGVVTPGTWTLPTHASFFTGLDPTEHRLLSKGWPLRDDVPTLAEAFSGRGYQTALISANPTLHRATGLARGFDRFVTSPGLYSKAWRGPRLGERLDELLPKLDPARPLFLVVNVFDAHDPYPEVPAGVPWASKQPGVDVNPQNATSVEVRRFVTGAMAAEERFAWERRLVDTYDWGVHEADANLGRLLSRLNQAGWLRDRVRLVVTSDHGEHLGEHGLVRHDGPPWEAVVRVPLLAVDTGAPLPALPALLSGLAVHRLVLDGALPEVAAPWSYAVAHQDDADPRFRQDSAARWDGPRKAMWIDGAPVVLDLATDPEERQRNPAPPEVGADLGAAMARLREAKAATRGVAKDPEIEGALRAMGYVE